MGRIDSYTEPWDGRHSGDEIEAFLKEKLQGAESSVGGLDARIGYFVCSDSGAARTVKAPAFALATGGAFKIKMNSAISGSGDATLKIGDLTSAEAKPLYYNGERASASNTWDAGETIEVYYDGTNFQSNNVAGGSSDGVFDVSAKYPTSGIDGGNTYTLQRALAVLNANLSASKKEGGMSIKFIEYNNVPNSDNKYVQYRLMADEWSIDTEDWAIAEEGVYIETPEFVYVKNDNEGKILWAIKADGSIYYGAGVPQQVIDYIESKIVELNLDKVDNILSFIGDLIEDSTLTELLNKKVDGEYIDNPEFVRVYTDAEKHILFGIQKDGNVFFGAGVPQQVVNYIQAQISALNLDEYEDIVTFLGNLIEGDTLTTLLYEKVDKEEGKSLIPAQYIKEVDNPEYIDVKTDSEGKILESHRSDGAKVFNTDVRFSGNVVLGETQISDIKNPEYMSLELDSESKVLGGRKSDGKKVENVGFETPACDVSFNDNPEYSEVVTDNEGKIIRGTKKNGEQVGKYNNVVLDTLSPNKRYTDVESGLPLESCNCMIRFKTKQSLFRLPITKVNLFSIPGIIETFVDNGGRADSLFMDWSRVNVTANYGVENTSSYIHRYNSEIRRNIYGKDLFSIRIKYPVVTAVDANGEATITEYMPERLQGAYFKKTDTRFSIYDGNDVELWGYNANSDDEWGPIIDAMISATEEGGALEDFEVIKYGCEGNTFGEVLPAIFGSKTFLSKETREIDYHQRPINGWLGLEHPMPSGSGADGSTHKWHMDDVVPNGEGREEESFEYEGTTITDVFRTYWDSYPTIIKTTDLGYEHYVRFNYHVKDGKIEDLYFCFDGYAWIFNEAVNIPADGIKLLVNEDLVEVTNISISPYKEIFTPAICMLHKIITTNIPDGDKNNITYQRLYDILSYFSVKGFANISIDDAISSIAGGRALDRRSYCLTFDDYRRVDTWQNEKVRTLLQDFNAKVSVSSLWTPEALYSTEPTAEAFSKEEYAMAKNSGWTIFPHGVGQYNPYLTYAQFKNAWIGIKQKWAEWYNEIPMLYGNHSNQMQNYQIMLMKHWGYSYKHGTAWDPDDRQPLLEAGASFIYNGEYPRFHIRGEAYYTWEDMKSRIDSLSPKTGYGISKY